MMQKQQRSSLAELSEEARIRGRLRGLETVWTLHRFTEVIRGEVAKGVDRAWSPERIHSWINAAYDVDRASTPHAARAIDRVLGTLMRERAPHAASQRPLGPGRQQPPPPLER